MKIKRSILFCGLALAVSLGSLHLANSSDHDDGVSSAKERNLNLTDLYVFREDNQTGKSSDRKNLILVMNSNPHTPGGQQDFFSTRGLYDFHITRVQSQDKNATPTGADDIILRFEFGEPDTRQRQPITMTVIRNGESVTALPINASGANEILTTSLADSKSAFLRRNRLKVDNSEITVFAGLREDPFFFDFEQFVKVRAGAAGISEPAAFRSRSQAADYFQNENINTIVVRVPIKFLQSEANEPLFDVWETISIK